VKLQQAAKRLPVSAYYANGRGVEILNRFLRLATAETPGGPGIIPERLDIWL
jgi:hypothetical protein